MKDKRAKLDGLHEGSRSVSLRNVKTSVQKACAQLLESKS